MNPFYVMVGVIAVALSAMPASAVGDSGVDRSYNSVWIIQSDGSQVGSRRVEKGAAVLRQRLLPPGLASVQGDVVDATGKTVFSKGAQLFQLQAGSGRIFCEPHVPSYSGVRSFLLGDTNLQRCLVDADSDGAFEGQFNAGNPTKGLPNIRGRRPRVPKTVKPVGYDLLPPSDFAVPYTVAIIFDGTANVGSAKNVPYYAIEYGDGAAKGRLTARSRSTVESATVRADILGASWLVKSTSSSSIDVHIENVMPEQPFGVSVETTYRFF